MFPFYSKAVLIKHPPPPPPLFRIVELSGVDPGPVRNRKGDRIRVVHVEAAQGFHANRLEASFFPLPKEIFFLPGNVQAVLMLGDNRRNCNRLSGSI